MLLAWNAAAVRAAEEPLLAAGVPLMDRASFALAVVVARELTRRRGRVGGARVTLLVGPGGNGGDTLFAGAHLARRGAAVTALLASDRVHDEGLAALRAAGGRVAPIAPGAADAAAVLGADVVLDGLLGIGGRGGVRGAAGELVAALADERSAALAGGRPAALVGRRSDERTATGADDRTATVADERAAAPADERAATAPDEPPPSRRLSPRPLVVAVDVPSGIGVDDGTLPGAPLLPADLVVTFGGAKPGLLLPPAAGLAARVEVVDVGLGLPDDGAAVARLGARDVAAVWPVPAAADHKYSRGVLGVVAGTGAYPGAAVLVTGAAVRAGVGMVRYVGDVGPAVVAAHPEVVAGDGQVQAWALGSGVDPHDEAQGSRIAAALASGLPAVVDAGALALLPGRVGPHVVLTPHAGELVRLLAAHGVETTREIVAGAPLEWARRAHGATGATVLLKGAVTVVVGPGVVHAQAEAPAWLATAGAGDVLAGLLGALLAGRSADVLADPALAGRLAAAAASVHGRAARAANPGGPVSASAVADALPATIAGLLR